MKTKSVFDGRFTVDEIPRACRCGQLVHYLRRGPMVLLPKAHDCPWKDMEQNVVRTIRVLENVERYTPLAASKLLNEAREANVS